MKTLLLFSALIGMILAAKLPHSEDHEHDEDHSFAPQPYSFGYEVRDDNTTNYQNRAEVSDDQGRVKGSYSYVLPDGFVYTVTYEDNRDGNGIQISMKKEPSGIEVIVPEREPHVNKNRV